MSITQSIPDSCHNTTKKAKGTQYAETSSVERLTLSKENVMSTHLVTTVSKEETMLVQLMPMLIMSKYKLTPCIPDANIH